jgi:hypothetical protein
MTTMTFDKLAYIDRLKAVGFTESQARGMADGLDQALREEVATKTDMAGLRTEMNLLRVELRGDFRSEAGSLRGEMAGLRGGLSAAMKADKIDFLKWAVMLIVGQTAVLTALKLLGH